MTHKLRLDMRRGVTDPVLLMISRRQVEQQDLASVLESLRIFSVTREDVWKYRGQIALVVSGYDDDARELVEISEVRRLLSSLVEQWPYWGFFMNQLDNGIPLLASCYCGTEFPGGGAALIDPDRLPVFMNMGFAGMNALFDRHGFPESELEAMSLGFADLLG